VVVEGLFTDLMRTRRLVRDFEHRTSSIVLRLGSASSAGAGDL
jgi:hypothetical protein